MAKDRLGYSRGVHVDCIGRSGGLALLWNDDLDVSLMSYSCHHIDVTVKLNEKFGEWWLSRIYGWPMFYSYEKRGGGLKNQTILEIFRETFNTCDLWEIEFKGNDFTWWNDREGDDSIEERLDRFMANSDWQASFLWADVIHIDDDLSDHLPIPLRLNLNGREPKKKRKKWFFLRTCGLMTRDVKS
ncbi:UDP-N-acetylglucosamine--N-acetylmuramyl-(pentapeptide) pyrophosphoryl-undecaprenol N-acetylglucosamine transferase [Bienertia sinuspersici]